MSAPAPSLAPAARTEAAAAVDFDLESSQAITRSAVTLMRSTDAVERSEASETLRARYVKIYAEADTAKRQRTTDEAARGLAAQLVPATTATPQTRAFAFRWKRGEKELGNCTMPVTSDGFLTVGRMPGSHVLIDQSLPNGREDVTVSRTHAMLLLAGTKLIVVDVGCAAGLRTLWRSDDAETRVDSMPHARAVLEFGVDECVRLGLGTVVLTITPTPVSHHMRKRLREAEVAVAVAVAVDSKKAKC
jgi:hypothetical protein